MIDVLLQAFLLIWFLAALLERGTGGSGGAAMQARTATIGVRSE